MGKWVCACIDACMRVCVWMGVCVSMWMDGCVRAWMGACMDGCMHGWVHVWMEIPSWRTSPILVPVRISQKPQIFGGSSFAGLLYNAQKQATTTA